MAQARIIQKRVTKYVKEDRFVLTMTEGEADFILGLLAHVGGHPKHSPRKYADRIHKALESALGYTSFETDAARLASGVIKMDPYSKADLIQGLGSAVQQRARVADLDDYSDLDNESLQRLAQRLQRPASSQRSHPEAWTNWYGSRYNPNA